MRKLLRTALDTIMAQRDEKLLTSVHRILCYVRINNFRHRSVCMNYVSNPSAVKEKLD